MITLFDRPSPPLPATTFTLRPYQADALAGIRESFERSRSALMVCPTGGGKTVIFAHLAREFCKTSRVLVLAHREELIRQAADKLESVTRTRCGIEMADQYALAFERTGCVVGTVQTVTRRFERFNPNDFGLVICDEAHHATAPTYRRVFDHFLQNHNLKLLGCTATPDRADEEALGQVFDEVAFEYMLPDAIRDGWLVRIKQSLVDIEDLDYSGVSTVAGDLNQGEAAEILERHKIVTATAKATVEQAGDRRTLIFAVSVQQAHMFADILNGIRQNCAAAVDGKTPPEERANIFAGFRDGQFQFLVNCMIATEGFDDPGISCVVMARPTKSRALYSQMAGRATRPLPGVVDGPDTATARREAILASAKPDCVIVDFVGNSGRHKLVTARDILGGKESDQVMARVEEVQQSAHGQHDMLEMIDAVKGEIHAENEERKQREAESRLRQAVKSRDLKVLYQQREIDPFDWLDIEPERERGYFRGKKLTEKQRAFLQNYNVNPEKMTFTQAQQVIGELKQRDTCTVKQARQLRRHGIDPNKTTKTQASALMAKWAKEEGWGRGR